MTRIWLDVPYSHKEFAKKAGARWDPDARRWYAPRPGMQQLQRWMPRDPPPSAPRPAPPTTSAPEAAPPAGPVPPQRTGSHPGPPSRAGASAAAKAAEIAGRERPRVLIAAAVAGLVGLNIGAVLGGWVWALALGTVGALAGGWWQRRRGMAARWRMGASGERRTGRSLARLQLRGWAVLHDRKIPRSRANIDHLAISPDGTVWNVDSKVRTGAVRYHRRRRSLRIGTSSGPQLVKSTVWESERIAAELAAVVGPVPVRSVLVVHTARLPPWHEIEVQGVRVLAGRDLVRWLVHRTGSPSTRAAEVAAAAEKAFPPYI